MSQQDSDAAFVPLTYLYEKPSPCQQSIELAAQCWCDPSTSDVEMDSELAVVFAKTLDAEAKKYLDDLEMAWVIIANAHGGNWELATDEWRAAAERWRHSWLDQLHVLYAEADRAKGLDGRLYYESFLVAMDNLADGKCPTSDGPATMGSYCRFMAGAAGIIRELRADKYENIDLKARLEVLEGSARDQFPDGVGFTVAIDEARALQILTAEESWFAGDGCGDLGFMLPQIKKAYPVLWERFKKSVRAVRGA